MNSRIQGRYVGLFIFALCGGVCLLFYRPILGAYFILDDFVWLECATRVGSDPAVIFNRSISNFFRPLAHLHFALVGALFGADPTAHHVASLLLHALNAALLGILVQRLSGAALAGILAGILFAMLPLHGEVMVWISAVTEPVYGAAALGALLCWHQLLIRQQGWLGWYLAAFIFYLMSLAAKEAAVSVLPLMLLLHQAVRLQGRDRGRHPVLYLPMVLLLAGYLRFQYDTQQVSYLVKSGMWAPGWHALELTAAGGRYLMGIAWIPLVILGLGWLCCARGQEGNAGRRVGRLLLWAGLLVLAFGAAILPYAMFTGATLPNRYFYLPGMVLAMAAGALAAPALARPLRWPALFPFVALLVGLAMGALAARAEIVRYAETALETEYFVKSAASLKSRAGKIVVVDGLLRDQQFQAAMALARPGAGAEMSSVGRDELPGQWAAGTVWAWDRVTRKFHPVASP